MRKGDNSCRIKILRSIKSLNKKEWDHLSSIVFNSYAWVLTIEENDFIEFNPYYLLVYKNSKLIAFALAYIQKDEKYTTISEAVLGPLQKLPYIKFNPCLLCYSPLSVMGKGIEIDPDFTEDVPGVMQLISKEMEKIAKQNKLKYYGFLNITPEDISTNEIRNMGFIECFTCFEMKASGPWVDFENYIGTLSVNMRNAARRDIKRHKKNELAIVRDIEQINLYARIINETDRVGNVENYILPNSFYRDLKHNMKENLFAIYDKKNDQIYSVALFLKHKKDLNYFKFGQDRKLTKGTRSIFVIGIYEGIRYVIENKLSNFYMGTGTYEYKNRRGGKPIQLLLLLKSTNKLNQLWLKCILAFLSKRKLKKHQAQIQQ